MEGEYSVRRLYAEELSAAMNLAQRVFLEYEAQDYSEQGKQEFAEYVSPRSALLRLQSNEEILWGAFCGEELVGMAGMRVPAHISLLFVEGAHHRRGIARALMACAIKHAKSLCATVVDVNSSLYAVSVYERLGFVATGEKQCLNGICFVPMQYIIWKREVSASMRKVIAYLAVSLDGFIATLDEKVDWLDEVETEGDAGYQEFYSSIDTIIMGRKTYDWVVTHIEDYPYKDKTCIIATHNQIEDGNSAITTSCVEETIAGLKAVPGKDIWLEGGGNLITYLLNRGLVDELRLTVAPLLLGSGIPLFTSIDTRIHLRLNQSRQYGQFIELDYTVLKG